MSNQWTFPLGAPADARRDLPVFSFLPNWKNGVTETLSWQTEVMSSEIGAEQRRPLRRYPRRTFEASFMREGSDRTRLDLFLAGTGKKQCLVPLWHEQFTLDAAQWNTNGSVQFPTQSLPTREFSVGDLVMITFGDPKHYAILYVNAVDYTIDQIQLLALENVGAWPQGSRIIPLRRARVLAEMKMQNPTTLVGLSQIRFQLSDVTKDVRPSWGPYKATWPFTINRQDDIEVSYFRSDFVLDFDSGVISVSDPGNQVQVVEGVSLRFFDRKAVYAFRQFLYKAKGRLRGFGMPTGTNDLQLRSNIAAGSTFDTEVSGFFEYVKEPQDARSVIRITYEDGRLPQYRSITDVQPILSNVPPFRPIGERFTVDTAFEATARSEVKDIAFYVFSRLDQDVVEIEHHTADSRAVSSKLVTRSVAEFSTTPGQWPPTGAGPGADPLAPAAPPPPVIPPEPQEPAPVRNLIMHWRTLQTGNVSDPYTGQQVYSYTFYTGIFDNITQEVVSDYAERVVTAFPQTFPVFNAQGGFTTGSSFITEQIENGNEPTVGMFINSTKYYRTFEYWQAAPQPGPLWTVVRSRDLLADFSEEINTFNTEKGNAYQAYVAAYNQWINIDHPNWIALRNQLINQYNADYAQYLIDLAEWEEEYGG